MDDKNAVAKYRTLMIIMVIILVTTIAPFVVMAGLYLIKGPESVNLTSLGITGAIGLSGLIVTLLIGKRMIVYKQSAMYDEFGVRKDIKNRLQLNSKDREKLEMQAMAELEKVIPRVALEKMIHAGSEDPEKDLNKMIGIAPVKQRILEMKARMEFEESGRKKNRSATQEGHHMIFTGAPGTGKTSVARIVTGLLYEYEYIDKNKVVECDGNFLKSSDANMTQTKVRYMCKAAYGGVLFVDEAYALTQSGDEAGLQAVATLIKEMEDSRGKFVVILAGYTNEMKLMLDSNPGFRSRIKEYLDFPDYNDSEMFEIFKLMASEKGFSLKKDEEFPNFFERIKKERMLASWGNARTARNIVEESVDRHAYRFVNGKMPKETRYVLENKDVSKNIKETI